MRVITDAYNGVKLYYFILFATHLYVAQIFICWKLRLYHDDRTASYLLRKVNHHWDWVRTLVLQVGYIGGSRTVSTGMRI